MGLVSRLRKAARLLEILNRDEDGKVRLRKSDARAIAKTLDEAAEEIKGLRRLSHSGR